MVTVRIAQDARFQRRGSDLHMLLPLTFTQAALGATKHIEGLLDEVTVSVPPGSQTGDRVKVPGAGMPMVSSDATGNLYCHIEVVVPRKLSKKQRELIEQLSEEFGDSERSIVEHHKSSFDKVKDWFAR